SEERIFHRGCFLEGTAVDGVDDGAGEAELHALTYAVGTSRPSCVDQPGLRPVFAKLLREDLGVLGWVPNHERTTEAGGECRLWFVDPDFRAGHFGRVPA